MSHICSTTDKVNLIVENQIIDNSKCEKLLGVKFDYKLIHERYLRLIYDDKKSTFENLLNKDKSVSIHHKNLRVWQWQCIKYKCIKYFTRNFKSSLPFKESRSISFKKHLRIYSKFENCKSWLWKSKISRT